jgi:glycine/serine hydroxymethyltransferase
MDWRAIEAVLEALQRHEGEARQVLNMVPSESSCSTLAKLPMLLDVYHRYFFNTDEAPDNWAFRGAQDVARLETELTVALLRQLTGAPYVNARPLSGLSGMAMVLSALGGAVGGRVMSVAPQQGGHYATAGLAARLGLEACFITGPDPHTIDYAGVASTLSEMRPRLIYVDQSNCLFPLDVAQLVAVTREVAPETIVHVDCSHWLGLVLGGAFPNPLHQGADSFGGSTHKTFPGPHKAIVATARRDLWERLFAAQYHMISSHHFAAVISLGIALLEFKECGGSRYAQLVIENTRALATALHARGMDLVGADRGFSRGHQLWLRTATLGIDAVQASDRLYTAGIRVNVLSDLPGIPEPALRLGVQEATYHGLTAADMDELAAVFTAAVQGLSPAGALAARVAALRRRYQRPFSYPLSHPRLLPRWVRLLQTAFDLEDPGVLEAPHPEPVGAADA